VPGAFAVNIETAHESAIAWLIASYPIIEVERSGTQLRLTSASLSSVDLELAWACSQANETLLSRGEPERTALLQELLA
jgi:hypothetical protein